MCANFTVPTLAKESASLPSYPKSEDCAVAFCGSLRATTQRPEGVTEQLSEGITSAFSLLWWREWLLSYLASGNKQSHCELSNRSISMYGISLSGVIALTCPSPVSYLEKRRHRTCQGFKRRANYHGPCRREPYHHMLLLVAVLIGWEQARSHIFLWKIVGWGLLFAHIHRLRRD